MVISFTPITVSKLVDLLQETIEDNFMQVSVEGEISNLSRPASGHLYLTLKDSSAQVRAVMFRGAARLLRFKPEDGQQVICRGRMTVYKQRGDMQFIVDSLDAVGTGSLQVAFEQLKEKLANEGLFASERKRVLPQFPTTIGVVTSVTGAVIHDMLQVFRHHATGIRVIVRPVRVQGAGAAQEIAEAIAELNSLTEPELLIVGRGGGALEDLWSFNEEIVARAIFSSRLPVISAVGHEVDTTIADYVADYRAATPTAAAEQVVKSRLALESHLDQVRLRLATEMSGRVNLLRERVNSIRHRLVSPTMQLALWSQRLQGLMIRLQRAAGENEQRYRDRLAALSGCLDALSPLQTLHRGYAIVRRSTDGSSVSGASVLQVGESLQVRFAAGEADVRVEEVKP
jgi:exodeoxyribonuclease VII large subunit